MKSRSKALLLTLCAVLLIAASIMGTMAYLTSNDAVTNTFSVGQVKITMDETDTDDSTSDAERDKANVYKLLPGHEYTKDPIIHVDAGSEDCYLFVKVENQISAIEADGDTTVAAQMAAKGWKAVEGQANLYVYVGTVEGAAEPLAVAKSSDIPVFEKIVIAGTVNNDTLAAYKEKTITVTAYAVQKDGFESKTAAEIWNAAFGE